MKTKRKTRNTVNAATKAQWTKQFRALRGDGMAVGEAVEAIAEKYDVSVGTVSGHITKQTGKAPGALKISTTPMEIEPVTVVRSGKDEHPMTKELRVAGAIKILMDEASDDIDVGNLEDIYYETTDALFAHTLANLSK